MPSQFFPWQRVAVALACALAASVVQADSFKMSTFNVAWLIDKPLFERWKGACQKSAGIDVEGLPYCNVHIGMDHFLEALRFVVAADATISSSGRA